MPFESNKFRGGFMSPKMEVQAHNMEVTDRIREYVTKKAKKLERFLPAIEEIRALGYAD